MRVLSEKITKKDNELRESYLLRMVVIYRKRWEIELLFKQLKQRSASYIKVTRARSRENYDMNTSE